MRHRRFRSEAKGLRDDQLRAILALVFVTALILWVFLDAFVLHPRAVREAADATSAASSPQPESGEDLVTSASPQDPAAEDADAVAAASPTPDQGGGTLPDAVSGPTPAPPSVSPPPDAVVAPTPAPPADSPPPDAIVAPRPRLPPSRRSRTKMKRRRMRKTKIKARMKGNARRRRKRARTNCRCSYPLSPCAPARERRQSLPCSWRSCFS